MESSRSKEISINGTGTACKRVVLFGCGYVGSALARALNASGHEVWLLSRNAQVLSTIAEVPEARKVLADLSDRAWHQRLDGEWDVAINVVSSAGGGLAGYTHSYVEGNRSIIEWAQHNAVKSFAYTSATSVYPQTDGRWVGEDDVPERSLLSPSGQILLDAENLVMESNAFQLPSSVLRLGGIYGPGRHLYLNRLQEGASILPGDGNSWLNLIYLDDIVQVLSEFVIRSHGFAGRILNLVDDLPSQKQDIVDWLAQEIHVPSVRFDPEISGPREARRSIGDRLPNRRVSNARIKSAVKWQPRFPDFRAGYRDILARGLA